MRIVTVRQLTHAPPSLPLEAPCNIDTARHVYAARDGGLGEPLYLRVHRVRSGEQQITVTVPGKPAGAGIDPRSLLIDVDATDNLEEIGGTAR